MLKFKTRIPHSWGWYAFIKKYYIIEYNWFEIANFKEIK